MQSLIKKSMTIVPLQMAFLACNGQSPLHMKDRRVVYPPLVEESHMGEQICCERPCREGGPVMEINNKENKIIVHNYGHGGAGWSLGPTSARHVVDALISKIENQSFPKDIPIAIMGAGVSAFFTARALLEKGYSNIEILAEKFDNLTSHQAGGLWAPAFVDDSNPTMREITIHAYQFYKNIANNEQDPLYQAVRNIPFYRSMESSVLKNYLLPPKIVTLAFQGGNSYEEIYAYDDALFMDTHILMQLLRKELDEQGVTFTCAKVNDLHDIKQNIIINTTGLGAKALVRDEKLFPALGHEIFLKNQDLNRQANYMLSMRSELSSSENHALLSDTYEAERFFSFFPKSNDVTAIDINNPSKGVIAGTYIANSDRKLINKEDHKKEFDFIQKCAKAIFYGDK